ncbi:MAG TPA: YbjN domain-containing protein [Jatrophihabitans sp.]|jgi:hypothetical protein
MSSGAQAEVIESYLREQELEYERFDAAHFAVALPGTQRLKTACLLTLGTHALELEAFVMRRPDENHERVYATLLQRNARTYGVHWSIDDAGDVYLVGRVPLAAISADEIDRLLGCVLEYADGSFNTLLELGFGSSIRREWAWRVKRGESLRNLEAFVEFVERGE